MSDTAEGKELASTGQEITGDPTKRSGRWFWTQNLICWPGLRLLYRLKVLHRERVPKTGGVLFVSNHQSFFDPVLVAVGLTRPMAFLARHDLFNNPIFAWWIRGLHAFPIHQGRGQAGPLRESVRLLQAGWALNVFPEGERTPDGELCPAQGGVALVIRRAKVPVVPCRIDGAFDAWPRDKTLPRPWGKITVRYGEPVELHDLHSGEIPNRIDTLFKELEAEAERDSR